MRDENSKTAMRRKAGAGRPAPEFVRLTPDSVMRAALAQSAEAALGLIAVATGFGQSRVALSRLADDLPEHALLILCEGPGGRFGLVILDHPVLTALIEAQTTGKVAKDPGEARPPTRTDAVLAADFIDQLLEGFETGAAEAGLSVAPLISGYRYAMPLGDVRAMQMTLDDIPYRQYRLDLDLGQGARQGRMLLLFPYDAVAPRPSGSADAWQAALVASVKKTQATLRAVLARKPMSLESVSAFQVGTQIVLPKEVLKGIEVEDLDGKPIAQGRLGQVAGMRAVRVTLPENPGAAAEAGSVRPDQVALKPEAPPATPRTADPLSAAENPAAKAPEPHPDAPERVPSPA